MFSVHILRNISRSKGNQTKKFGPLLEYNMRNISLENYTQMLAEKLFSDPFLKTVKLSISLDQ